MKAIGYLRVSTDDQADNGVSLEAQGAAIKKWCESNGHELVAVHGDPGLSGKRMDNRPGLGQAIKEAKRCKAALVVYSLSRLARNLKDGITIAEALRKAGARLVSLTEGETDTETANGNFMYHIQGAVAELERRQTGERTKAALAQLKKQGRRVSGRIPYGFSLNGDGKTLKKNAAERKVIGLMHQLRESGLSYGAIAMELNKRRIPTKLKTRWTPGTVWQIICRKQ